MAGADHRDAEEDEVGGAGVADELEGGGGSGEDGGEAEGGGGDMDEAAGEGAERGESAFATAAMEGAAEDVEDAGARGDGEQEGGGEEEGEAGHVLFYGTGGAVARGWAMCV